MGCTPPLCQVLRLASISIQSNFRLQRISRKLLDLETNQDSSQPAAARGRSCFGRSGVPRKRLRALGRDDQACGDGPHPLARARSVSCDRRSRAAAGSRRNNQLSAAGFQHSDSRLSAAGLHVTARGGDELDAGGCAACLSECLRPWSARRCQRLPAPAIQTRTATGWDDGHERLLSG